MWRCACLSVYHWASECSCVCVCTLTAEQKVHDKLLTVSYSLWGRSQTLLRKRGRKKKKKKLGRYKDERKASGKTHYGFSPKSHKHCWLVTVLPASVCIYTCVRVCVCAPLAFYLVPFQSIISSLPLIQRLHTFFAQSFSVLCVCVYVCVFEQICLRMCVFPSTKCALLDVFFLFFFFFFFSLLFKQCGVPLCFWARLQYIPPGGSFVFLPCDLFRPTKPWRGGEGRKGTEGWMWDEREEKMMENRRDGWNKRCK